MTTSDMPAELLIAEMKFQSLHREHPPITRLMFNMTLRNPTNGPRWFLLPSSLGLPANDGQLSVFGVEVYRLAGTGRVILGRFLGAIGFKALLLPAGAELIVRDFSIQYYGEIPKEVVPIEVVVGRALMVGGEPAEGWYKLDPICDPLANVSEMGRSRRGSRSTSDLKAVPVSIDEDRRLTLLVNINKGAVSVL